MFIRFDIIKMLFTCAAIFSALKVHIWRLEGLVLIVLFGLCELHAVRSSNMTCTRTERRKEVLVWPE